MERDFAIRLKRIIGAADERFLTLLLLKQNAVGIFLNAPQIAAPKEKVSHFGLTFSFGADYGARTRHLHLGKVALYQMS